jgi:predicted phosphodiesterase
MSKRRGLCAAYLIFLLASGVISNGAEKAEKIAGGPFVVNVTPRTATLVWLVQTDEVLLRPPAGAAVRKSPLFRIEKTIMTGLQPNTRYEYDVPSAGEQAKGSFKTAPSGVGPYRFFVYGDTRTRHDVHRQVMDQVMKHGIPDFILHTGDLVADGYDSAQWPIFFDIEGALLRQTAFFPSLGNHERDARYFYDMFNQKMPYYSFDWGNGHFVVLDSDIANVASSERAKDLFWTEERRWLEDELQSHQNADYRFVVAHHPPFTAVARRQGDNPHMTDLVPLFEKYHVSAAFFGHDHNYQHYLKNGIHYVTTGGGGAPLYDVDKPAEGITQKAISVENFVSVTVDNKRVSIQAIAIDGRVLDAFEIGVQSGTSP